jgi:hypothetical protein
VAVVIAARTVEPHHRLPGTIGETLAAVESRVDKRSQFRLTSPRLTCEGW